MTKIEVGDRVRLVQAPAFNKSLVGLEGNVTDVRVNSLGEGYYQVVTEDEREFDFHTDYYPLVKVEDYVELTGNLSVLAGKGLKIRTDKESIELTLEYASALRDFLNEKLAKEETTTYRWVSL